MNRLWAKGDGDSATWHLVTKRPSPYGSGDVYVRRCMNRSIYSPWGVTVFEGDRPDEREHRVCKRCGALYAQLKMGEAQQREKA